MVFNQTELFTFFKFDVSKFSFHSSLVTTTSSSTLKRRFAYFPQMCADFRCRTKGQRARTNFSVQVQRCAGDARTPTKPFVAYDAKPRGKTAGFVGHRATDGAPAPSEAPKNPPFLPLLPPSPRTTHFHPLDAAHADLSSPEFC